MNKKKLPKAIQQLPEGAREADVIMEAPAAPSTGAATALRLDGEPPNAIETNSAPVDLESPSRSAETPSPMRALVPRGSDRRGRRRLAERIVERYANYSALGGVIPLPILNVGAVTTIIVRMVKALSNVYGVPFERDRAHAIVFGLVGGLTPTATSTLTASTLLYLIPGSNLVGLAVSSVTASTCARKIGGLFVDHFESGASLIDFPLPRAMNRR